ncbi:unnamed protein product [Notodromas monacha]|uniref:Chitinase n=1 Tax=Notodromas monacha TaxID=399045 RepID=A0A7R9BY88_9CRUS|nr:unnamed protein product [Notodromas monacha]CAG0923036.1 unnamed protein product [Notodromas monacha]
MVNRLCGSCLLLLLLTCGGVTPGEIVREKRNSADYFECPQPTGLFADPKTCRRFISCVEKHPYLNYCPPGLYFDDISKSCTFKNDAHCGPISTTEAPTTTIGPDSARKCEPNQCQLPYCFCSSDGTRIPKDMDPKDANEMIGMREILRRYANVSIEDILGMRAPFLMPGRNAQYEVLRDFKLAYDSSVGVPPLQKPVWPYTLDYEISHECKAGTCPTKSFPGIWEIPLNAHHVHDYDGGHCPYLDQCVLFNHDPEDIFNWLREDFERYYNQNRAPYVMAFHTNWFQQAKLEKGLHLFVDWALKKDDVWFVTATQALLWITDPVPNSEVIDLEAWDCTKQPKREPPCKRPTSCGPLISERPGETAGSRMLPTKQFGSAFWFLLLLAHGGYGAKQGPVLLCYLGSWATYSPGHGKFDIDDPAHTYQKLCTHVVYSFAGLDNKTDSIRSLDPFLDYPENGGRGWYEKSVGLKAMNPKLKVLMAIGGWNEGSENYSNMAASKERRAAFVESVLEMLKKFGFDGLDLDWEYPARRGGKPEDKQNFVELIRDLKKAFKPHGFLLTAAVGATVAHIEESYNVREMSRYLDLVNVMAYDYHGPWDKQTGHNAPLHASRDEPEESQGLNVEMTVKKYLDLGCPPEKMVLGLPLYGRSFVLTGYTPNGAIDTSVGAPTSDRGFMGPYTRENGFLSYLEICEKDMKGFWKEEKWDNEQAVPYLINGTHWVSFDNERSLELKVQFAMRLGLGGAMVWSVNSDDLKGICGKGQHPLLTAINSALVHSAHSGDTNDLDNSPFSPHQLESRLNSAPTSASAASLITLLATLTCFMFLL